MRLLRSLSFRLALTYAGLFCLSSAVLVGLYYWAAVIRPMDQMQARIAREAQLVSQIYIVDGARAARDALERRTRRADERRAYHALILPGGEVLTANLPSWPTSPFSGWAMLEADVARGGFEADHAPMVREVRFRDGARLIIGRDAEDLDKLDERVKGAVPWVLGSTLLLALAGGLLMSRAIGQRIEAIRRRGHGRARACPNLAPSLARVRAGPVLATSLQGLAPMCGIAGWYRRGSRPIDPDVVRRQCYAIVHRGPDGEGYHLDGDIAFGMRRLSIVDIEGGQQPMSSPDGRYVIVSNGEIYNHLELRRELEAGGYPFRTRSDTETLLAAYVRWGDEAWPRLEGMYATAIWDRAERRLTLARDPLGIKPLYVTQQDGGIGFASELRALRPLPGHAFDIDERAVQDYFMFGHVQRPRSIYRQVRSLDPGTFLRIGPEGEAREQAFWRPSFGQGPAMSEAQWIEETRERLLESVRLHMLSDVPLGVFLSGGVDSSAVLAAMTRIAPAPYKAFTIGFPGSAVDETAAASRIARHLGCEHIVLPLEPAHTADLLPAVQSAFDEPCAATSAVPHWHLSKLAAEHVKVVLCGEGSDEIFAGYKRQRTAMRAARWRPAMRVLEPLARMAAALPAASSPRLNYLRQNAVRFCDSARLESSFQRFFAGTQMTTPDIRTRLYEADFHDRQGGAGDFAGLEREYFPAAELRALSPLQQFQLADLTVHMPGSLLTRLDRPSMAHSLEARVPFLSHKFVDWVLSMPLEMKVKGKVGKHALREAVRPWLPEGALMNRKLGFQLPFAEWFRGDFSEFAREAWHSGGARQSGYLRAGEVDALFAEHRSGVANHGRLLYAIAMFSCWWEQNAADRRGTRIST